MVIRGGFEVGVMEGVLVMVGIREGVKVWSSVGEGIMVTGMLTSRVTRIVAKRVTSLVTSTVWMTGTIFGVATEEVQETPVKISKQTVRP